MTPNNGILLCLVCFLSNKASHAVTVNYCSRPLHPPLKPYLSLPRFPTYFKTVFPLTKTGRGTTYLSLHLLWRQQRYMAHRPQECRVWLNLRRKGASGRQGGWEGCPLRQSSGDLRAWEQVQGRDPGWLGSWVSECSSFTVCLLGMMRGCVVLRVTVDVWEEEMLRSPRLGFRFGFCPQLLPEAQFSFHTMKNTMTSSREFWEDEFYARRLTNRFSSLTVMTERCEENGQRQDGLIDDPVENPTAAPSLWL